MKCGWCGIHGHTRVDCPAYMIQNGRWTEKEREILQELHYIVNHSMSDHSPIRSNPNSARLLSLVGR